MVDPSSRTSKLITHGLRPRTQRAHPTHAIVPLTRRRAALHLLSIPLGVLAVGARTHGTQPRGSLWQLVPLPTVHRLTKSFVVGRRCWAWL